MVNIAVCEDEMIDRDLLEVYISDVTRELMLECKVDYFDSGLLLLERVAGGRRYDLIVLDIIMDGINGIDTAKKLREILPNVRIGFITGSADFALDAFEIDAIHYLIKPVDASNVKKMMLRFLERFGRPVELLTLDTPKGQSTFPVDSILKVVSFKKGVEIYLQGKKEPLRFRCSFMSMEEQLNKNQFIKIARGLIVNMDYIDHMETAVCYFVDGTSALISRSSRSQVRKLYNNYLLEQMKY